MNLQIKAESLTSEHMNTGLYIWNHFFIGKEVWALIGAEQKLEVEGLNLILYYVYYLTFSVDF